jgi:hypothetical protein
MFNISFQLQLLPKTTDFEAFLPYFGPKTPKTHKTFRTKNPTKTFRTKNPTKTFRTKNLFGTVSVSICQKSLTAKKPQTIFPIHRNSLYTPPY